MCFDSTPVAWLPPSRQLAT